MDHAVIGVLGASGGLGASTLTVALAQRAARVLGTTACVDGRFTAGGLDVTACVEHLPGLRWDDLCEVRGEVDGAAVLSRLPADVTTRVLAAGAGRVPDHTRVVAVLHALSRVCPLTVVDLPREGALLPRLLRHCHTVLVLAGLSARQLADASSLAAALAPDAHSPVQGTLGFEGGEDAPEPIPERRLVVRGSRRAGDLPEELAARLDLPLAGVWADDARVATDAERGRPPGSRAKGTLGMLCDRLLGDVIPGWTERAGVEAEPGLGGFR